MGPLVDAARGRRKYRREYQLVNAVIHEQRVFGSAVYRHIDHEKYVPDVDCACRLEEISDRSPKARGEGEQHQEYANYPERNAHFEEDVMEIPKVLPNDVP